MDSTFEIGTSPTNFCPLPNSSSVLLALACLTPPSPILTPSQIPPSFTSGDILIFLDGPIVDGHSSPESPTIQETISQSFSMATVGTFGVSRRRSTQDLILHPSRSDESGMSISAHSISSVAADSQDEHNNPSPDVESDFNLSTSFTSSDTLAPRSSYASLPCHNPASIPRPQWRTQADDNTPNDRNAFDDGYKQSPPSQTLPVSSLSSYPPDDSVNMVISRPGAPRFKRIFDCDPDHLPHRNGHDPSIFGEGLKSQPPFPAASIEIRARDPRSAPSSPSTAIFDHTCRQSDGSFTVNSAQHSDSASLKLEPSLSHKYLNLPEHLYWLKGIKIELLIDQEGFRSIQPSFSLVGYSSQSRSLSLRDNTSMDPGVAQFMPSRRQTFLFHYAPFDTPPILRRLTLNGDESYDYISRQASLCIKANGVYTVRGTETSSASAHSIHSTSNHGSEVTKISWQFDYMVSDRRVDSTCKFIEGERIFTPLTFSCSPALLNSLQGKKVRLMQVVRKSVVPKLVAEKMEPPKLPTIVPAPPLNIIEAITWSFEGIHKRAHSYVHRHARHETRLGANSSAWNTRLAKAEIQDSNAMVGRTRRRRASSAGEQSRLAATDFPVRRINSPDERASTSATLGPPHHILPPSYLCALISADQENQPPVASRDHLGLQALTPRDYRPSTGTTRN